MDKGKKKRKIIVPIICLLLSIGLWLYITNVENPMKTIEISKIPVKLINGDYLKNEQLTLSPNQEFYVDLKVEGLGNRIYKLSKDDFKLEVDLSEYALKKGENKIPVNLVSIPQDVNIRNTNSIAINVNLEDLSKKMVKISSEVKVSVKQGFFASKAEINPAEVEVSGPESLVESVNEVIAVGEEKEISQDVISQYPLKAINSSGKEVSGVLLSKDNAEVTIKITKGKSVPLKIATTGQLPTGISIKGMDATRKSVEVIGPKEVLDKVTEVYSTQLDLSTISESKKVSLKVVVPPGVTIIPGEEYVDVTVNVTKSTTKEFDIPVTLSGEKENLVADLKKQTVKVSISGDEDVIKTITADKIKASVNLESYTTAGSYEIAPELSLDENKSIKVEALEKVSVTISNKTEEKPTNGEVNEN